MRPRGEEYQRFIHLVDCFRDMGWQAGQMLAGSPFKVADIATNAILLRAERDLSALSERFGSAHDRSEIGHRIARLHAGIGRLWNSELGLFNSYDLVADAPISAGTSAGFLPLFAHATTPEQAEAMAATLAKWETAVPWLVPSADPAAATFEPLRYWRGPIWAVVNWMIADGFAAAGNATLGARIHDQTAELIRAGGLSEYFDPTNGRGVGGADFSWTAAILLLLEARG